MMSRSLTGINKEVATGLASKIAQGQPLAEGMKEWFAPNVVEIIRVGEAGGALEQTIQSAVNMLTQQGVAIGGLIAAIAYPLFVIVIACGLIIYLKGSVFEQFRMIKSMDLWPEAGQRLYFLAGIIKRWWWIIVIMVIAICILLNWLLTNYVGALRPTLDRFPPFSLYRRLTAARLLETLGLLVANGVVFKSAVKVMQLQASPYLYSHLLKIEYLLSMGRTNIADVLDTGLVSDQDLMRLRVMAEVKGFEHGLTRMGLRGSEQVASTMRVISKVLGGILLAVGGILILIIIQGIFMTGMSMGS
jgi:type II secretory pathway component PulF